MSNTTLPTGLNSGSTGHITHANIIHAEMNELSRGTGRRMATGLLANGWTYRTQTDTSRGVHIERIRDMIHVYISGLDGTNATSPVFLPFGDTSDKVSTTFMPYGGYYQSSIQSDNIGGQWSLRSGVPGLEIFTEGINDYKHYLGGFWRVFSYPTRQGWPTFLPPVAP